MVARLKSGVPAHQRGLGLLSVDDGRRLCGSDSRQEWGAPVSERAKLSRKEAEPNHIHTASLHADRGSLPPLLRETESTKDGLRGRVPIERLRTDPAHVQPVEGQPTQKPGGLRGQSLVPVARIEPIRQALDLHPLRVEPTKPDSADARGSRVQDCRQREVCVCPELPTGPANQLYRVPHLRIRTKGGAGSSGRQRVTEHSLQVGNIR